MAGLPVVLNRPFRPTAPADFLAARFRQVFGTNGGTYLLHLFVLFGKFAASFLFYGFFVRLNFVGVVLPFMEKVCRTCLARLLFWVSATNGGTYLLHLFGGFGKPSVRFLFDVFFFRIPWRYVWERRRRAWVRRADADFFSAAERWRDEDRRRRDKMERRRINVAIGVNRMEFRKSLRRYYPPDRLTKRQWREKSAGEPDGQGVWR